MRTRAGFVASILALCALPFALQGCLLTAFTVAVGPSGGFVSQEEVVDTRPCDTQQQQLQYGDVAGNCHYEVKLVDGVIVYDSVITLEQVEEIQALQDPVVLQVPAGASAFAGTFDNGSGASAGLSIRSGLRVIPADYYTQIVAEPGMQLVVIEFPSPPPPGDAFKFSFGYSGAIDTAKAMTTGRVTALGKTFYPPLLPCEVDFANIPALSIPAGTDPTTPLLRPLLSAVKPCDKKSYKYPVEADPADSVEVVEYYNPALDHYFITWGPDEIATLDAGVKIKGWRRTGQVFRSFGPSRAGTSPVCRFYMPPPYGDSHFYGRGTAECNATAQKNPGFVLEDGQFMNLLLPVNGICPPKTTEIYRVFSNRPDANHRYMTNRDLRDQMVATGWLAEGDGKELVVMCAARAW